MKNPLNKRIFRELRSNIGRYGSIFIVMLMTISFISSFYISQNSVKISYEDSHIKGKIEDGYIEFDRELSRDEEKIFEDNHVKAYKNYYLSINYKNGKLIRLYSNREHVNIPAIHRGRSVNKDGEVVLNYNYIKENKLSLGDKLYLPAYVNGKKPAIDGLKIVGSVAFPDYSCLLRRPGDILMDNKDFAVASVNKKTFDDLVKDGYGINYIYSYRLEHSSENRKVQSDKLEDLVDAFVDKGLVPINAQNKYRNPRISYVMDDMGGDVPMMTSLMVIVLLVMAFIFAVLVQNTIEDEASVIGSLLSFGYSKASLIWHYIKLPLYVTVFAVLVGNLLAYTHMKNVYLGLYTGTFSLFPVRVELDAYAFLLTSLIPISLILLINFVSIYRKLRLSPLRFLRRELSSSRQKKAIRLPQVAFLSRFRMRVFLKNKASYLVLCIGLLLGNILLIYGLSINILIDGYMDDIEKSMPSSYQTILKGPLEKEVEARLKESLVKRDKGIFDKPTYDQQDKYLSDAMSVDKDKVNLFTMYGVKMRDKTFDQDIKVNIYASNLDGAFIKEGLTRASGLSSKEGGGDKNDKASDDKDASKQKSRLYDVYLSDGLMNRFKINMGDQISMKDENRDEDYRLRVIGHTDLFATSMAIIMDRKDCNKMVGMKEYYYNGIFTDKKLKVEDKELATIINSSDMKKIAGQFMVNFKNLMPMIMSVALVIYLVVMYVLTKTIVDKYKESISYLRIFGYYDKEIEKVFIRVSTIAVAVFLVILIPLEKYLVRSLVILAFYKFDGYVDPHIPAYVYLSTVICGMMVYLINRWILVRRIKKINMSEVLKDR
ncbi:FtsX-like permease family protein [Peptostreptococcus stomatis]|uniref:FtsX-like permease family protein n=1 Tax=Peptostreptococcus stomatis TaxID=341694 RepID=UPI0026E9F3DD|nr:FtsX-like permease family protein [Peptostreptococcus stomatis]